MLRRHPKTLVSDFTKITLKCKFTNTSRVIEKSVLVNDIIANGFAMVSNINSFHYNFNCLKKILLLLLIVLQNCFI